MYRYAEGTGTAARFDGITDIDFLSSTELICTDRYNHCLRLVDLSQPPPETSTFAGSCTVYANADGHRLKTARFRGPLYTEVDSDHSTLYVLDAHMIVHTIDLLTDTVTILLTLDTHSYCMKFFGDNLLYFSHSTKITVFDVASGRQSVLAGESKGNAVGSLEHTRFYIAQGLLQWTNGAETLVLVADYSNNRFAVFSFPSFRANVEMKVLFTT